MKYVACSTYMTPCHEDAAVKFFSYVKKSSRPSLTSKVDKTLLHLFPAGELALSLDLAGPFRSTSDPVPTYRPTYVFHQIPYYYMCQSTDLDFGSAWKTKSISNRPDL